MEDGAFGVAPRSLPTGQLRLHRRARRARACDGSLRRHVHHHMRSKPISSRSRRRGDPHRREGVSRRDLHLKAVRRRQLAANAQAIAKIDSARRAGLDVQANMYPYPAGATGLSACTPPWASEGGRLLDNLRDPATRTRITGEMQSDRTEWENLCRLSTPEGVLLLGLTKPENRQFNGKRLADVVAATNKKPEDAVIDLLIAEGHGSARCHDVSEDNVRLGIQQPWIKSVTDAAASIQTVRAANQTSSYGTFPRIVAAKLEERCSPLKKRSKSTSAWQHASDSRPRALRDGFSPTSYWSIQTPSSIAKRSTPPILSSGVRNVLVNGVCSSATVATLEQSRTDLQGTWVRGSVISLAVSLRFFAADATLDGVVERHSAHRQIVVVIGTAPLRKVSRRSGRSWKATRPPRSRRNPYSIVVIARRSALDSASRAPSRCAVTSGLPWIDSPLEAASVGHAPDDGNLIPCGRPSNDHAARRDLVSNWKPRAGTPLSRRHVEEGSEGWAASRGSVTAELGAASAASNPRTAPGYPLPAARCPRHIGHTGAWRWRPRRFPPRPSCRCPSVAPSRC